MLLMLMYLIFQIKEEVRSVLEFINYAYNIFGFTFDLKLSTVCWFILYNAKLVDLLILQFVTEKMEIDKDNFLLISHLVSSYCALELSPR